jgi:hypothetical protein
MGAILEDIRTWTESAGGGLRAFTAPDGNRWIEQNSRRSSGWARLAQQGRQIAWEFGPSREHGYTGRVMIDGQVMTKAQAIEALWGRGFNRKAPRL